DHDGSCEEDRQHRSSLQWWAQGRTPSHGRAEVTVPNFQSGSPQWITPAGGRFTCPADGCGGRRDCEIIRRRDVAFWPSYNLMTAADQLAPWTKRRQDGGGEPPP